MTASQKMYLTSIYILSIQQEKVLSVDVAHRLEVSRASVCKAMKLLFENGFVEPAYQTDIRLTPLGVQTAQDVLDHESIVVRFLKQTLALPKQQADEYAPAIAHMVDTDTLTRMKQCCESNDYLLSKSS